MGAPQLEIEILHRGLSGKWWRSSFEENDDQTHAARFQNEFCAYQHAERGVVCTNGTAALEVALKALGVGPGDEVIVPSYTFVSTATAVLYVNAVPIFVDIDPNTYNIDPARIEEAITDRTKVIIPVHFFGQPANMDEILRIAKKHDLKVLEDSSHAHGSEWRGQRVGALGDIGTFSFQNSKNMTAGEGGIILTNNQELADLCESYIWIGREKGRPWYEFHRLGWNYRITEFQSAILRVQLERLDEQIARRQENVAYFYERITNEVDGLKPITVLDQVTRHSWHIVSMRYDPKVWGVNKRAALKAVNAEGVPTVGDYSFPLYKNPLFLNKAFNNNGCPVDCPRYKGPAINYADFEKTNPVAEFACSDEAVWLEHRLFLGTREDVDDIVNAFIKVQRNINEL